MSKGGQSSTVTSTPDVGTQNYVNQIRRAALGYAGIPGTGGQGGQPNPFAGTPFADMFAGPWAQSGAGQSLQPMAPPPNPAVSQAVGQYGNYANLGQQGIGALTGGPNPFMNTYLSAMDPFFAQQRARAVGAANDQATLGGAFGGDRSGIAAATAGNLADQTQAGFNVQQFNQAQQRAMQAAQMGYGATGLAAFLPQQYAQGQINLLGSAIGPYGTTQAQQMQTDPLSQALGLGATAAGLGLLGPVGGALGGLFSGGGPTPQTIYNSV